MIYEKIKCPLCGCQSDVANLGKEPHTLAVALKHMGGYGGISWSIKYSGYNALKKKLVPILESLLFHLSKENGCDMWPDCLSCLIPLAQCPDEKVRAAQKQAMSSRRKEIQALQEQGLTNDQIAAKIGRSTRTVSRDLQEVRK